MKGGGAAGISNVSTTTYNVVTDETGLRMLAERQRQQSIMRFEGKM
jgi:hypothetical protein